MVIDEEQVRQAFDTLSLAGDVREVRIINHQISPTFNCTTSGYFDNADDLVEALHKLKGSAPAVYITANRVNPDAMSRASNKFKEKTRLTTKDADIVGRDWLFIDLDPNRMTGISATDDEKARALDLAFEVVAWLTAEHGFDNYFMADSGNGYHLMYPIDMPNDKESDELIKRFLASLSDRFSTEYVKVDKTVHNAARITKLYGTLAAKGDSTESRPHRMSSIMRIEGDMNECAIDEAMLLAVAGAKVNVDKSAMLDIGGFDIVGFLDRYSVERESRDKTNYTEFYLLKQCPFDPSHGATSEVHVGRRVEGNLAFQCMHDTCKGKGWKDFRGFYDATYIGAKADVVRIAPERDFDSFIAQLNEAPADHDLLSDAASCIAQCGPAVQPSMRTTLKTVTGVGVGDIRLIERAFKKGPGSDVGVKGSDGVSIVFPHLREDSTPKATKENVEVMLEAYDITCKYNLLSKESDLVIPKLNSTRDNELAISLTYTEDLARKHDMPYAEVGHLLTTIADDHAYNPVADWIDSVKWDEVDRFEALVDTLGVGEDDRGLAAIMLHRWLLFAVEAAYTRKGVASQGVLTLQGDQYIGKTTWLSRLVGGNTEAFFKDGCILDVKQKDSVKIAVSKWIVELGEVDATFNKSDISHLKAFLTSDTDEMFLRYSRKASNYARRTVFCASVNPSDFLNDTTGNRRFWVIPVDENMNGLHDIDMQQLWAQIKKEYLGGARGVLSRYEVELVNANNERFEPVEPMEEILVMHYDFSHDRNRPLMASEVLADVGIIQPTKKQLIDCRSALCKLLNIGSPRKSNGRKVYDMPSKKGSAGLVSK